MNNLPLEIVKGLKLVIGDKSAALHEPFFGGKEWIYVKNCIDSSFVSSVGEYVDRFENDLAEYTGAKSAVAVVNGTAALHIALKLCGVLSGDEVLVPAMTFIATANAVSYCNATPHFVDIEERSLGIDPDALRDYLNYNTYFHSGLCINKVTKKVIRAIVPMHVFGHPGNIDGLLGVANDFNLQLIEDAAESLGSTFNGLHTGTFASMGILSFNGNKTITTGGGGAILFNDSKLAKHAKHITTTAKIPHRWEFIHNQVGYNYRLPNINAALGCAQLEQLDGFIDKKRNLYKRYYDVFKDIVDVNIFTEPSGCRSNYWLQTLVLQKANLDLRNEILSYTNDAGYGCRPVWNLLHRLDPFKGCPRMPLAIAETMELRLINLPSSAKLGEEK